MAHGGGRVFRVVAFGEGFAFALQTGQLAFSFGLFDLTFDEVSKGAHHAPNMGMMHLFARRLVELCELGERRLDLGLFFLAGGEVFLGFSHNLIRRGGDKFGVVEASAQAAEFFGQFA